MPFLRGSVTFQRFRLTGAKPLAFAQEHLDRLHSHSANSQRIASADGIETGWTAGGHCLDTDFKPEKNIFPDHLCFDFWVQTDKLPSERLKAYYEVELKALSASNPSARQAFYELKALSASNPSARQRREAKEIARDRLEQEAKDGRYRKQKCYPVLWDNLSSEVLFGATSLAQVDRFCNLFERTFELKLEHVSSGRHAYHLAELNSQTQQVDDSSPSAFIPGVSQADVAWIADESSRDFIGNEFLLWLWYYTDIQSDTIKLRDESEVTVMLTRTLTLECPRGQTGRETISSEGPTRLPEARRAIQSGKLPRKIGLILVRHGEQYECAVHAETFAIAAAKLPAVDEGVTEARAKLDDRLSKLRSFIETIDLLYDAFCQRRFGNEWGTELAGMQTWLKREERRAA